jgi:hypothetical protein
MPESGFIEGDQKYRQDQGGHKKQKEECMSKGQKNTTELRLIVVAKRGKYCNWKEAA